MMNAFSHLHSLYTSFRVKSNQRERFDSVLEPFQAVLQLCLLSKCPSDTKVAIHENTLRLQPPHLSQGIIRWSRDDKKSDLMFLFQVCRRFPKLYKGVLQHVRVDKTGHNLFEVMTTMASKGLKKLAQTYAKRSGEHMIPQMLHLYCNVLLKPKIFGEAVNHLPKRDQGVRKHHKKDPRSESSLPDTDSKRMRQKLKTPESTTSESASAEESQIDLIFGKMRSKLYSSSDFWVVYHCLSKLASQGESEDGTKQANSIIKSMSEYFKHTNHKLRKLLLQNIVV